MLGNRSAHLRACGRDPFGHQRVVCAIDQLGNLVCYDVEQVTDTNPAKWSSTGNFCTSNGTDVNPSVCEHSLSVIEQV
jgi:hypothetical protein